jgi:excisionase family DNA binding protein
MSTGTKQGRGTRSKWHLTGIGIFDTIVSTWTTWTEVKSMSVELEADRLLIVQEICELLKVKKTYISWLTYQKKIPFIKMQGHLRFRKSTIDDWLQSQEIRTDVRV